MLPNALFNSFVTVSSASVVRVVGLSTRGESTRVGISSRWSVSR